jgi:hypothetical protein
MKVEREYFINHALSPEFKKENEPRHELLFFVANVNITGATGTSTAGPIVFAPCLATDVFALEQAVTRPPTEGAGGRLSGLLGYSGAALRADPVSSRTESKNKLCTAADASCRCFFNAELPTASSSAPPPFVASSL